MTTGKEIKLYKEELGSSSAVTIASFDANGEVTISANTTLGLPDTNLTVVGPTSDDHFSAEELDQLDCLYLNSAGKWAQTDADSLSSTEGIVVLATHAVGSDEKVKVALPGAIVRNDSWNWTPGSIVYLSTSSGNRTTLLSNLDEAGDVVKRFGFAWDANSIYIYPSEAVALSASQSGAGALPTNVKTVELTTTGTDALTLADGASGQEMIIVMVADGGDGTLTPTNFQDGTTATFTAVGQALHLVFAGGSWNIVSNKGVTIA